MDVTIDAARLYRRRTLRNRKKVFQSRLSLGDLLLMGVELPVATASVDDGELAETFSVLVAGGCVVVDSSRIGSLR